jgi:CBS domain-containing protein
MKRREEKPTVKVRDVMRTAVMTVLESQSAENVSKLMRDENVGSVVVVDKQQNPIGIITERDIVSRVAAENVYPSKVSSREIMSSPVVTVSTETSLEEAARTMSKRDIRRLVVIEKGKLVGIITSREIVSVTPTLVEVISEKVKVAPVIPNREEAALAGYCDTCGGWSEMLSENDGKFLCEDCLAEVQAEE